MTVAALSAAVLAPAIPAPAAPLAPNPLATERFAALMSAPVASAPAVAGAPAASAPALTGVQAALQSAFVPAPPATLGGQILSGLRSTAADFSQKWRGVAGSLDQIGQAGANGPSVSQMLRLQGQLLQVSVQYELIGKAVSRATQNVNTLVTMS